MKKGPLRQVARIVVLDAGGSVLLVRYQDVQPMDPESVGPLAYWVPPGGGLNPGESYESAAARELEEETGLTPEIGPLLWKRRQVLRYKERLVSQHERYFLARTRHYSPGRCEPNVGGDSGTSLVGCAGPSSLVRSVLSSGLRRVVAADCSGPTPVRATPHLRELRPNNGLQSTPLRGAAEA